MTQEEYDEDLHQQLLQMLKIKKEALSDKYLDYLAELDNLITQVQNRTIPDDEACCIYVKLINQIIRNI